VAWLDACEHVVRYAQAVSDGDPDEAEQRRFRLTQRPNLDAFYSLLRFAEDAEASKLLEPHVLAAVRAHTAEFRGWLAI
jgi:hypothetical protein